MRWSPARWPAVVLVLFVGVVGLEGRARAGTCGDNTCDPGETAGTCPDDCDCSRRGGPNERFGLCCGPGATGGSCTPEKICMGGISLPGCPCCYAWYVDPSSLTTVCTGSCDLDTIPNWCAPPGREAVGGTCGGGTCAPPKSTCSADSDCACTSSSCATPDATNVNYCDDGFTHACASTPDDDSEDEVDPCQTCGGPVALVATVTNNKLGGAIDVSFGDTPLDDGVCDGGNPCTWNVPLGATVTLTALPIAPCDGVAPAFTWTGACASAGSSETCTLVKSATVEEVGIDFGDPFPDGP